MAPEYSVSIYNASGVIQAISQDFLAIKISRTVNAPDVCVLAYNINDAYVDQFLAIDAIITVTRWNTAEGIAPAVEFAGIVRRITRVYNERNTIEVVCYGMMDILSQRVIAYKAGITNRSKFTAVSAETIIKTLFSFNIGSNATVANGRALDGRITGMATSASSGTGNIISIECSYANLLTTMQDVAEQGGGDFSVSYTAPATWTMTWHLGQLGANRTATVVLSLRTGTLGELVIDNDKIADFNATIVGGTGEGTARLIATRPTTLPTGLALKERFIDARSQKKAPLSYLESLGTVALDRQRKKRVFSAKVLQNAALKYGRDYFIGDLVTIYNNATGVGQTQKITGVGLGFEDSGREVVEIELSPNA
jgi:hypothetical protein